jgi:Ca2+-binding RTX toxin-like protein
MRIPGTVLRDTLHGTMSDDEIHGDAGNDTLYGNDGLDWLYGEGDNDYLYGGNGNDTLLGGDGNDHLYGEADNDWLYGLNDDDFLFGGDGRDHLFGGADNDWLHGGDDADYLYGGTGIDTAAYGGSDATVFVSLVTGRGFGGDAEGDQLTEIENLSGSRFADLLVGNDQNNELSGLGGNDSLLGGDGGDHLNGGEGDDTLNGGGNTVRAVDAAGHVYVTYQQGDVLTGDGPDNVGADRFVFSSIEDIGNFTVYSSSVDIADIIMDFNSAEGDRIDLRPIDADTRATSPGNQDFSTVLIPEGTPFTAPGQISWTHYGADTFITLNTDGDLFADATLRIAGWHTPDASWFS